jgi:hypothetical protein
MSVYICSWGLVVDRLLIDFGELVKVTLKNEGWEKGSLGGLRGMGASGICVPCVYLAACLLL